MLTSTKQCLEALAAGSVESGACAAARASVANMAAAAASADSGHGAARSVDDELADMDLAIEHAASQIEVYILVNVYYYFYIFTSER